MTKNPKDKDLREHRIAEILASLRENMAALDGLGLPVASAHISHAIELLETMRT